MREAIVYLVAITAAETITTVALQPMWGIAFHIIVMTGLMWRSAVIRETRYRPLILSLTLVPLVRIVSLSMPLSGIPQIWWYPIIYTPLFVGAIMVVRLLGYKVEDVGINIRSSLFQLTISLSGFLFGVAEYLILQPKPIIARLTWQEVWLPALIFFMFVGFVEEFIFRGVLQRVAVDAFGGWGIVYIGYLFAILHMGFLSWVDVVFVFVVALFLGWAVKRTGSLFGVTLSHGITNSILYLVAPFLFKL